jgi:predicted RNase H-like nuclease
MERPWRIEVSVVSRFAEMMAELSPAVLAVDMPIGLPERVGAGGRGPERLVRPLLGTRKSSVFSVPSRAAVHATNYQESCTLSRATSHPPRGVSLQCFHLFPKMREVDVCLRENPAWRDIVHEAHPEVAFWRLNGRKPLNFPKKVKGRPFEEGLALRRRLLLASGLDGAVVHGKPPRGAAEDDLLDALANFTVAERIARGAGESFPPAPERDAYGLPIAIWT